MMLLEIDNFEQFKIFFDVIFDVTEYVELQLFQDHMKCSILDKAHTRFMNVTFQDEFFAAYEVEDAESVILFADDLHKIIKSASKIDCVILMTNEDYLICKMESNNGNSRVFEFVLPSEVIESPHPPSISLPIALNIEIDSLKQGVKDLKILGASEIQFNISNENLSISSGTEIYGNYSLNIPADISVEENISSRFSLEYIEQLLKFNKINNTVELKLGDNYPLLYSFNDESSGIEIDGLIAPRLEVED